MAVLSALQGLPVQPLAPQPFQIVYLVLQEGIPSGIARQIACLVTRALLQKQMPPVVQSAWPGAMETVRLQVCVSLVSLEISLIKRGEQAVSCVLKKILPYFGIHNCQE